MESKPVSRESDCYSATVDKSDLRSSVILLLVLPPGSQSGFLYQCGEGACREL